MMALPKVPNTSLLCILRHRGVLIVRRILQDSESRKLAYLRVSSLGLVA